MQSGSALTSHLLVLYVLLLASFSRPKRLKENHISSLCIGVKLEPGKAGSNPVPQKKKIQQ